MGRGGMGVVWRAYDPDLQREVAVKLLRRHALGEDGPARLVREARAMAQIAHPNVVAVYDVRAEHDGSALVVMEFVVGSNLKQWLEGEPRTWRVVLDAFVSAGRGLAAAHARGILHRDFKPDNVLVARDGRVCVTDFGLARSVHASSSRSHGAGASSGSAGSSDDLSGQLTAQGAVMGTPPYMAPEQHVGGSLDPSTDQYAFCVSLWRALTGELPFAGQGRALLEDKLRASPRWPAQTSVPRHVVDALRRGLAAEPGDRWPSMPALLAELDRDPSSGRRRMLGLGASLVVVLGFLVWRHEQREARHAECAARAASIAEVWNDDRSKAIEARFAATGLSYATETWTKARDLLDAYATRWADTARTTCEHTHDGSMPAATAEAADDCLAERRDRLDALLARLDDVDAAVVQRTVMAASSLPLSSLCADERWLSISAASFPTEEVRRGVRTLRGRLSEAQAMSAMGHDLEALPHVAAILADAEALGWPPLVAEVKLERGNIELRLGRLPEAEATLEQAYFEADASGREELALEAATVLVEVVGVAGARHDEGLHWAELARARVRRLELEGTSSDVAVLTAEGNLARARGTYDDALGAHERAVEIAESVLGPEHPRLGAILNNLATVRMARGETRLGIAAFSRSLALREAALGGSHPSVGTTRLNLCNAELARGEYTVAVACFERASEVLEPALGPEHPHVASLLNNMGTALRHLGEYDRAIEVLERALAIRESALGVDHPDVAGTLHNIASVLHSKGEIARAQGLEERALRIKEKALGPDHPDLVTSLVGLGTGANELGDHAAALAWFERALAIATARLEPDHPNVARARFGLAQVLWAQGTQRTRALELATEARESLARAGSGADADLARIDAWLADR